MIAQAVPWSVAVDETNFELVPQTGADRRAIAFTAYFRRIVEEPVDWTAAVVRQAHAAGPFRLATLDEVGEYHRVLLVFSGCLGLQICTDKTCEDILNGDAYDWSGVPGHYMKPGESVQDALNRGDHYFLATGFSWNPGFYEVIGSNDNRASGVEPSYARRYLLLGDDNYVNVTAQGWRWELGQVVA
jgi:hypothetical protein